MGFELTVGLALAAAGIGGFCGWMGARRRKPMSAPRLVPWRFLMILSFAFVFMCLIHVGALLGHR